MLALPQPQSSSIRRQCKIAFPSCWWSDGIVCFRNVFLMANNLRTFVLNTSTMHLDFQYMICFRNDEFAYARAVAKKIPDFLRPCHPRQPLCKAVNSVRACLMSGLACTSYAINILFNQIFKTYAFGVGAQQVCIRAMMAFSAFSNDVRLATEPVWSICTVPLAFGTCALLRGTDGSPVSDNVWSEPAFSFKGLRPRVLCSH